MDCNGLQLSPSTPSIPSAPPACRAPRSARIVLPLPAMLLASRATPHPCQWGWAGEARTSISADAQLPDRLVLDKNFFPRKNLISLYTDDEREHMICEIFSGLKETDVDVRGQ